jgi:hypothetical protein
LARAIDCYIRHTTDHFLDHVHNFLLHQIEALGIASWSAADNVVDTDIVFVLAHATAVHGIGELDKDRVFLHDALDVLATDANDALMVLVRDVEGDRGWHLLLDQVQAILGRLVGRAADVNVEVVFVEAIEDDLRVA